MGSRKWGYNISWVTTILVAHIQGQITRLLTTHEPPSRGVQKIGLRVCCLVLVLGFLKPGSCYLEDHRT